MYKGGSKISFEKVCRILTAFLLFVVGCTASEASIHSTSIAGTDLMAKQLDLRGVWVQADSIMTKEKIDETIQRAIAGHFNAIFVNVFLSGNTMYESRLAQKYEQVETGFDPLAYLVPVAHRDNIQVHAWFVTGWVGDKWGSQILAKHPDWALVGPDGDSTDWLNFTKPEVRAYIRDLMLEVVQRYGVDGLHFDYTRYPGPEWGFDPYSVALFKDEYGLDLNLLRYTDLPAYGVFEGNPLTTVNSAQVLAKFSNGYPAVTLNKYGKGETLLFNWDAAQRSVAVSSEILKRILHQWVPAGGSVNILRSETNAEEYGYDDVERVKEWLEYLDWPPQVVKETDLTGLESDSVLILPYVYLITNETAAQLADFVIGGGKVIFIDGPTRSIHLKDIQRVTGLQSRGRYFNELMLMQAVGENPLVPTSQRNVDFDTYQKWDAQWKEFRKKGINELIQNVYRSVKSGYPRVLISVTISSDQEKTEEEVFQDWRAWLKGGYIDLLIPRLYVENVQDLKPLLNEWEPIIQENRGITLGLIVYKGKGKSKSVKTADQLRTEINLAQAAGSNGIMIFDLDNMNNDQLQGLTTGVFTGKNY